MACARVDRLAEAAKRAGRPGRVGQIAADVYLGLLDGRFDGSSEEQIIAALLGVPAPRTPAPTRHRHPAADGNAAPGEHSSDDLATADDRLARDGAVAGRADKSASPRASGLTTGCTTAHAMMTPTGVEIRVGWPPCSGSTSGPARSPGSEPALPGVARDLVGAPAAGCGVAVRGRRPGRSPTPGRGDTPPPAPSSTVHEPTSGDAPAGSWSCRSAADQLTELVALIGYPGRRPCRTAG